MPGLDRFFGVIVRVPAEVGAAYRNLYFTPIVKEKVARPVNLVRESRRRNRLTSERGGDTFSAICR